MEHPSALSLQEIALEHTDEILNAITQRFGFPHTELTVLDTQSFLSASGDGSICFPVMHQTGMYGVNATRNEDGTLSRITVVNLQAAEYQ